MKYLKINIFKVRSKKNTDPNAMVRKYKRKFRNQHFFIEKEDVKALRTIMDVSKPLKLPKNSLSLESHENCSIASFRFLSCRYCFRYTWLKRISLFRLLSLHCHVLQERCFL